MNKQNYRKAMESIVPSDILIRRTAILMQQHRNDGRQLNMRLKRYGIPAAALLAACSIILLVVMQAENGKAPQLTWNPLGADQPIVEGGPTQPSEIDTSLIMQQIESYYVPFQASQYIPVRAPFPHFPLEYETLKQESSVIVKVTIKDLGIYREKDTAYNPRASFGTYIYVALVESVLYGEGLEEQTLIPISEIAWAMPDEQKEAAWSFKPYTARPLQELKQGEQYVLFLSEKDRKETYPVAGNGIGVFSLKEMEDEAKSYTIDQLRELHYTNLEKTSQPMLDNLVYRLFALETYNEFDADLNK